MSSDALDRRQFLGASASLPLAGAAAQAAAQQAGGFNETIDQARRRALGILKPSRRDLDYGLALHADSLVFESYGFAPRAAPDGDAMLKAIEAGASAIELGDMREDMSMTRAAIVEAERSEFLLAWRAAGMTCIFQNAGEEGSDPMLLIKRLARFTFLTDGRPEVVRRAVHPEDVVRARKDGIGCLFFSGNGVPITQAWVSVEDELRYVRLFYQLGIRMMHLTYNRRNVLGDGCAETANGGLSDFGRAAIDEMNRVGVIVDVAHSGHQTSLEAARRSSRPMVASHTVCTALNDHIRAKPDKVIRAIADTGGYIGICCIPKFLGGPGNISAFLDHIDYAVKKFGAERVAIGTDVAYTSRNAAQEYAKLPRRGPKRTRWAALWPPNALGSTKAQRESMAWTNWPLFTVGMVQRGHSDETIRKILGGNVLRVVRAVAA